MDWIPIAVKRRNLKVDKSQDNWKIASLTLGFVGDEVVSQLEWLMKSHHHHTIQNPRILS